jgi:hypothetical protein
MLFKVIKYEMKSQAPLYIFYGNNNNNNNNNKLG